MALVTNSVKLMKIEILGNNHYDGAVPTESGNFKKWIKLNYPDIEVSLPNNAKKYALHDYSLILPLVNLALEGTLINYLNLVYEYAEFIFRGFLKDEKNEIKFTVKYKDSKAGVEKEFHFEGSSKDLKATITKFNINKFMDK